MLEKITCKKICQKRPPTSGGTPDQATRGTCRLGQCRQAPVTMPPLALAASAHHAAIGIGGKCFKKIYFIHVLCYLLC
jgi:hypothetical protein